MLAHQLVVVQDRNHRAAFLVPAAHQRWRSDEPGLEILRSRRRLSDLHNWRVAILGDFQRNAVGESAADIDSHDKTKATATEGPAMVERTSVFGSGGGR